MDRAELLKRVRERQKPWDIIVIGGGATGAGCALDAASRGLDVLLLEQHDFGKGTSSRSTKLIHGGVRYLEQGNISLVREALKERSILLRNASHVVRRQAFVVPCYSHWQKIYYGIGLKIYDRLAGKFSLGGSRLLSKGETIAHLPSIKQDGLRGGILYYDASFDDTRLLIDLITTGHSNGAAVLNYAKVTGFLRGADPEIAGVEFQDMIKDERLSAAARVVINATGAFCDDVRRMSGSDAKPLVTLSQGIHLVFDRKFLPSTNALMIPKTADGRVLFCIPWHGSLLVGTTDTPTDKTSLEPRALEAEIDFVLNTAGRYLDPRPTRADIRSIFVGIRPLVSSGAARSTASLSRGHTIEIDRSALLTITGGKWTTYRHMAEDAVDQAIDLAKLKAGPSVTESLALNRISASQNRGEILHSRLPYGTDDVIRAVREEMAQTVEDVLARRTRALFIDTRAGVEAAPHVAKIMAKEMGKDEAWAAEQIEQFNTVADGYLIPETGTLH